METYFYKVVNSGNLFHPGVKQLSGVASLIYFFQMLVIDMLCTKYLLDLRAFWWSL